MLKTYVSYVILTVDEKLFYKRKDKNYCKVFDAGTDNLGDKEPNNFVSENSIASDSEKRNNKIIDNYSKALARKVIYVVELLLLEI